MAKKTNTKKAITNPGHATKSGFEVCYEAQPEQALKNMPEADRNELDALYDKIEQNATEVIPRLQALKKAYPKVMLINNYLAVAYGYIDKKQQKKVIEENYRNNKTYLFARCHYAQSCLSDGAFEKIPVIFDHKTDLKSLYPRRSRFHINEYLAFMSVMCLYCNAVGHREQAEKIYQDIVKAAPESAEAQQTKQVLYPGFGTRLAKRLKGVLAR